MNDQFRVEDITFKGARRQSEILKEMGETPKETAVSGVPVSMTPEQVKQFYLSRAEETDNMRERALYHLTVKWIDDMLFYKKRVTEYELREEKIAETKDTSTEVD